VTDRLGHDRRYAIDITRASQELGWQPRHSLASGLLKTVEWYLSHPDWIDAIRKQQEFQGWLSRNYAGRGEAK
jgi:dTDP-glucose 4,6-dehydratase